jgi:hypothetical protein
MLVRYAVATMLAPHRYSDGAGKRSTPSARDEAPSPIDVEFVERVLDMRASRLEAAAASLREIETRKREAKAEVCCLCFSCLFELLAPVCSLS